MNRVTTAEDKRALQGEPAPTDGSGRLLYVAGGWAGKCLSSEVFVNARLIGAEGDGEEKFFERHTDDGHARQGLKVPHPSDVTRRRS